jgi:hypothetical protein
VIAQSEQPPAERLPTQPQIPVLTDCVVTSLRTGFSKFSSWPGFSIPSLKIQDTASQDVFSPWLSFLLKKYVKFRYNLKYFKSL